LKKDGPILIIFGTNIDSHQMTVNVPTSPNVYFCTRLPGKSRTSEICVEM